MMALLGFGVVLRAIRRRGLRFAAEILRDVTELARPDGKVN